MIKLDNNYFKEQINSFLEKIADQPYFLTMADMEKNLLVVNYTITLVKDFYDKHNIPFNDITGMEIRNIADKIHLSFETNRDFCLQFTNGNKIKFKTKLKDSDINKLIDKVKSSMAY